jgi:hypothetical protein
VRAERKWVSVLLIQSDMLFSTGEHDPEYVDERFRLLTSTVHEQVEQFGGTLHSSLGACGSPPAVPNAPTRTTPNVRSEPDSRSADDCGRSAPRSMPSKRYQDRRRDTELLDWALRDVQQTGLPRLVTLLGEPGIGKSRLIDEFRRSHESTRCVVGGTPRFGWNAPLTVGTTSSATSPTPSCRARNAPPSTLAAPTGWRAARKATPTSSNATATAPVNRPSSRSRACRQRTTWVRPAFHAALTPARGSTARFGLNSVGFWLVTESS